MDLVAAIVGFPFRTVEGAPIYLNSEIFQTDRHYLLLGSHVFMNQD